MKKLLLIITALTVGYAFGQDDYATGTEAMVMDESITAAPDSQNEVDIVLARINLQLSPAAKQGLINALNALREGSFGLPRLQENAPIIYNAIKTYIAGKTPEERRAFVQAVIDRINQATSTATVNQSPVYIK